jgi:hypothetical protein
MTRDFSRAANIFSNGKLESTSLKDGELYLIDYDSMVKCDIYINCSSGLYDEIIDDKKSVSTYSKMVLQNDACAYIDDELPYDSSYDIEAYTNAKSRKTKKMILVRFNQEQEAFEVVGSDIIIPVCIVECDELYGESRRSYSNFYECYLKHVDHPFIFYVLDSRFNTDLDINDYEILLNNNSYGVFPLEYNKDAAKVFKDCICGRKDLKNLNIIEINAKKKLLRQFKKTIKIDEEVAYYYNELKEPSTDFFKGRGKR